MHVGYLLDQVLVRLDHEITTIKNTRGTHWCSWIPHLNILKVSRQVDTTHIATKQVPVNEAPQAEDSGL